MSTPTYVPVPVESLVGDSQTEFDLHLQLGPKHVLYLRKGGVFDTGRLAKMREKNVKSMWILDSDEAAYRAFFERRVDQAYDPKSSLPAEERARFIHMAQAQAAEAILKDMTNAGVYMTGVKGAKKFTEYLINDESALKTLLEISSRERTIANHGVAVAAIAVTLAKRLGHGGMKDLHLLTLGCLLHDAGHFDKPDSGFGVSLKSMSVDQLKKFIEHTTGGVRKVQEQVHFDQHVTKVILEHEELIDGTGYPKGLKKEMHLFPILASTANSLDQILCQKGETFSTAVRRLVVEKIGRHPLTHINALKAMAQAMNDKPNSEKAS